jgi:hypothetical protein
MKNTMSAKEAVTVIMGYTGSIKSFRPMETELLFPIRNMQGRGRGTTLGRVAIHAVHFKA